MKRQYTLADLRSIGVETVSKSAIIGKGANRKQFPAGPNGVVFDFDKMKSEEQLKVGALVSALEKKAAKSAPAPTPAEAPASGTVAKPAPVDPETGELVVEKKAPAKKKVVAKKAAPKQAE